MSVREQDGELWAYRLLGLETSHRLSFLLYFKAGESEAQGWATDKSLIKPRLRLEQLTNCFEWQAPFPCNRCKSLTDLWGFISNIITIINELLSRHHGGLSSTCSTHWLDPCNNPKICPVAMKLRVTQPESKRTWIWSRQLARESKLSNSHCL